MLCAYWGYRVSLEESVKQQKKQLPSPSLLSTSLSTPPPKRAKPETQTPAHVVPQRVSEESKADYSVYTVRDDQNKVVAVLMEAKLTTNPSFRDVLAQLLGYFVWFISEDKREPLCVVLSEQSVQLLFFPYENEDNDGLVECIALP